MIKIAVIGAGTMGAGIAQIAAEAGNDVRLMDIKLEFVEKGIETIIKSKRVYKAIDSVLKAEKETLNCIEEKIVRCKDFPQIFIVDNDIKEACKANAITGIDFEEIRLTN